MTRVDASVLVHKSLAISIVVAAAWMPVRVCVCVSVLGLWRQLTSVPLHIRAHACRILISINRSNKNRNENGTTARKRERSERERRTIEFEFRRFLLASIPEACKTLQIDMEVCLCVCVHVRHFISFGDASHKWTAPATHSEQRSQSVRQYLYWRAKGTPFHCLITIFPAMKCPQIVGDRATAERQPTVPIIKLPLFCLLQKPIFKRKSFSFIRRLEYVFGVRCAGLCAYTVNRTPGQRILLLYFRRYSYYKYNGPYYYCYSSMRLTSNAAAAVAAIWLLPLFQFLRSTKW